MRGQRHFTLLLLLFAGRLCAQTIFHQDEILAPDRPEAWAMNYFAAASVMTAFGGTQLLAPGHWDVAFEVGHVPRLSDAQQRVGFNGTKREDLNKSPVFGRVRVALGLPAGWVAELGYTPPLTIDGTRPHALVAVAFAHAMVERGDYILSARVFGQHGTAQGDITCPGELAGVQDSERNPYGCQAASSDRLTLNYYGVDLVSGWRAGRWHWHVDAGAMRTELAVQVDALTYDVHDRSRLVARDLLPFVALGTRRGVGRHWSIGMEVLHVPLTVRRQPGASPEHDPLTSLRMQLRYHVD